MAMETMRSCLQSQYDPGEIYSPPRVVKEATSMGMKGGFSLDVSAPNPDGYILGFQQARMAPEGIAKIRETKPYMIIGSQSAPRSRPSRT